MKNKHLIKTYTLSDGEKVTCRQVAEKVQISESAARNRLNRSDDPKKIFAPYLASNGGQPRKIDREKLKGTKKNNDNSSYEQYLLRKVLMTI